MLMLRCRPRAVTSKQAKMADHTSLTSPTQDHTIPISPFSCSPRFFRGFITKGESETATLSTPTSILDTKPLFSLGNPIWYDNLVPKSPKIFPGNKQYPWEKLDSKDIGLAIIGSPNDDTPQENSTRPCIRRVMFGSQLKVQIPPLPPTAVATANSPESPANSRTNNRNPKLGSVSVSGSPNSSIQTKDSPRNFSGCLSEVEMKLPEDHTCVIFSHGHNPKTTHIFENFIVEGFSDKSMKSISESFLSFCYTCKKKLEQEKDIYIYKGEKAFCSRACRYQEMMLDGMENSEFNGAY